MQSTSAKLQSRLGVFAGPNGSGKSTIIRAVQNTIVNGERVDFGSYINADDIAVALQKNRFSFAEYGVDTTLTEIIGFAKSSGLLTHTFNKQLLVETLQLNGSSLQLTNNKSYEYIAQLLARYLRERMLVENRRFSFETVFSHPSNLDIMRKAAEAGYKVYLYFVSTESPEINKYRVQYRVAQKGHNVPADKIESRYYRSLELLYDAAQIAYQCFFFDNSDNDHPFRLVNHFKKSGSKKMWDTHSTKDFTNWFKKYYWEKENS